MKRKLSTPWRVIVAVMDPDGLEPAYSLEPDISDGRSVTLTQLQRDIGVLAEGLVDFMQDRTRALMRQVDEFLESDKS